jgi:lysozyme family protein
VNFDPVIDGVLDREAPGWRNGRTGFSNNPSDRGGPTTYGITQRVAQANGYTGPMPNLPLSLAREIYMNRYIVIPAFDKVAEIDAAVGSELIDTGVNMYPSKPSEMFQRWLNGFNLRGSRYANVFLDGRIGEVTLDAFRAYSRWRGLEGSRVMVAALNGTQAVRYLEIAENTPSQEDFLYGWIRTRVLGPAS